MSSVAVEGKVCTGCGIEKKYSEFSKKKTGKGGVRSACKFCEARDQRIRLAKPDKYFKHCVSTAINNARSRATERGQPFDPEFFNHDFVAFVFNNQDQMCCPLCFKGFMKRRTVASFDCFAMDSLSFDCVIPDRGYTRGNVMAICFSCNKRKNDNSLDWFRRVVQAIESRMEVIYRMPRIDPPNCTP